MLLPLSALASVLLGTASAFEYYTFDGPGSPSCHNVVEVHNATSVDEMVSLVKDASSRGLQVRAGGRGHMWYDTQCSDDETVIIRTEFVNGISDFDLEGGSVVVEGGVTFFQLAEYLHERGANIGTGLVNWNITLGGSIAMGAHRTSLREDAVVVGGVLALDIIDGNGDVQHIERDESNDDWLAASTSLGLLGIIARIKMQIFPETKVYAMQTTLDEKDVLNGDIYKLISPYLTANFWWWPSQRKFHWRTYDIVPTNTSTQQGFQSTFSVTALEAAAAVVLLNSGKISPFPNLAAEGIFFGLWEKPNFHDKVTDEAITEWPVYGWNYDVLIGGLYPGQKPEWEANEVLKRIRALFDAEEAKWMPMASTYRSGINIKFGKAHFDFLGQVTTGTADKQDWSKGAIMFDFPSFRPSLGDQKRYNEAFYINLANTLVDEFPCRPHWTKNTRDVFQRAVKNLDPSYLARFKAVRQKFDPKGIYRSAVGEIIGMYD
ncbi:FAD binding domain-containing protein [Trichoderma breve]|uniref:D-arabinono-1,4-lactone oxidase n=1 Tax=Trichoderma breve TaxID=2034170 RepID=A0A9W9E487_9HYPO|nr:FAD binding domain-containing protein [Trichoderma breve]KAJ4857584.1 FAD binding domain-containing protein [Trichoderma breve]